MKKLIIANWKMNPASLKAAIKLANETEKGLRGIKNVEIVIAPPFPFLAPVNKILKQSKLGAQDFFWKETGPATGEVSGDQLKHLRVSHVIIGHSERRALGETDEMINKKIKAALKAGLVPILAVGERKKMSSSKIRRVLSRQLSKGLHSVSAKAFENGVIAYEPVWAIGTGLATTPEHAKTALAMIKEILSRLWKIKKIKTRIIYGGSVNAKNAAAFISPQGGAMDGMLVGGMSLHPREFINIVRTATKTK